MTGCAMGRSRPVFVREGGLGALVTLCQKTRDEPLIFRQSHELRIDSTDRVLKLSDPTTD